MSLRRFDARQAWTALSDDKQRAIGEAALLLQVSTEAQMLAMDDRGSTPAARCWERAEQIAWQHFAAVACAGGLPYLEIDRFAHAHCQEKRR